ncbi:MAG TPA: hypothetical protein VGB84_10085 [Arachidicoccus sp.]
MKNILLFFLFLLPLSFVAAQQSDNIYFILRRLDSLQIQQDNFFLPGAYPSYINNKQKFGKGKKDITVFYNILIDITLKKLRPKLKPEQQILADSLLAHSVKIYPRFKNKTRGSYNFWLRDSAYTFPYSWWIPLIKKDAIVPDDMDDTSLSQLIISNDSAEKLHQQMQLFTGIATKKLKTINKKYRSYNAYSTWFGKKFPVVFDVAVLSNMLTFVQTYNLSWTHADSSSLQLIAATIKNKDYIYHPLYVSPYYGKTAILLYHFARLMQMKKIDELEILKPSLINECHHQFNTTNNLLIKIIVANALHDFGEKTPKIYLPGRHQLIRQIEENNFPFFIGNISSYFHYGMKKFFTQRGLLLYYHYCPAYNDALLLEYLVNSQ